MALLSHNSPNPNLPPELWSMIFKYATDDHRFFDTPVHVGERFGAPLTFRDPFCIPGAEPLDSLQAFAHTQQTKKAIAAVCKDWRKCSYTLLFRRIVIRRVEQLELLLHVLEASLSSSSRFTPSGLGWWVTHIKFYSLHSMAVSHIRRLLACCPRIQVFIDAAPYGVHQRIDDIFIRSLPENAPIASLEWIFGGPDTSFFLDFPSITDNLVSLRCMTCHFPRDNFIHPRISFSKLQYLELFLSPETFSTWTFFAENADFPSLTNCTLRTPTGRSSVSIEGTRALESFLRKFGAQLQVFTLRVCPGDDMSWDEFAETNDDNSDDEEPRSDRISVSRILALCPNLNDIILSSRWLGIHRDRRSPSSSYIHQPTGRHHLGWKHPNVKHVGLYDVGMSADGFSTGLAHRRCSCTPAPSQSPRRTYYPWESPPGRSTLQIETDGLDGTVTALPNMTRRQCIIDHELGILLGTHTSPGSISQDTTATTTTHPHNRYPTRQLSFPNLQSIHLLDADPMEMFDIDMFSFSRSTSSSPLVHAAPTPPFSLYNRARDVPPTLDERSFWQAWSAKCTNRGVKMVDGDGKMVSRQSSESGISWSRSDRREMSQDSGVGVGQVLRKTFSGGGDTDESRVDVVLDWFMGFG